MRLEGVGGGNRSTVVEAFGGGPTTESVTSTFWECCQIPKSPPKILIMTVEERTTCYSLRSLRSLRSFN